MIIIEWAKEIGVSGFIDITVMTVLLYSILVWMKRTKRAAAIITGILIVAVVFLLARQFNLLLTAAVLQGFFAVILVALVVIFQEELRYFFERVTHWSLNRRLPKTKQNAMPAQRYATNALVRTLRDLSTDRIGALVVIRGRDTIIRHLDGCEPLGGQISEKILKSIFDPHSIGHDGAVIIEGSVIQSFGCHLPLSKNLEQLKRGGTRHAAALGLSELTDALCLVVSEERGTVSVAHHGSIQEVNGAEHLSHILESFYHEVTAGPKTRPWEEFFRRNYREKILAVSLALSLWFVLVHEANTIYRTYHVPVQCADLPADLVIRQLEPNEITVTLSGQRKAFYFLDADEMRLILKPWQLNPGRKTITISGSDFVIPEGLVLENVEPRQVSITVENKTDREWEKK